MSKKDLVAQTTYLADDIRAGGRATNVGYVYDPKTKTWKPSSSAQAKPATSSSSSSSSSGATKTTPKPAVVKVDSASKVDSKAKADKKYKEIEFNTLEGDVNLIVDKATLKIKSGDTIRIEGVGKYLSGLFFVSSVKRNIDKSNGYSHSVTVIRTGFGDSLKKVSVVVEPNRPAPVPIPAPKLKKGDKVKIVGASATYANAASNIKVPEWVKKKVLTIDGFSKDETKVRLMPIWSWTYAKYVKKV